MGAIKWADRRDLLMQKTWSKNATWLGRRLRRSAAVLRKVARIDVRFDLDLPDSGE